jgi:hypothetical protein
VRPQHASSLYGRGLALRASGERARGEADIAAAVKADPEVRRDYREYGVPLAD